MAVSLGAIEAVFNLSGFYLWEFFKVWWWLILPALFYFPAKHFYLWWIQWEVWYKEQKWMLLEIIPPAEIAKPFRAMEDFYAAVWPIYDSPNWREQWCEGEFFGAPFWFSFEVASFEGEVHYYVRILKNFRDLFESTLYSHYPDMEIMEAEDYTQKVPQNIPNKEYDFYGEDYVFMTSNPYPIKTYKFFEIRPEEIDPEKKVDPFASFLERMAKVSKGQQFWFQVVPAPITNNEIPWVDEGKKIVEKLARRVTSVPPDKTIAGEAFRFMLNKDFIPFAGQEKKEEPIIPPEMKLTPGERLVLSEVEEKISKLGFKTWIRGVYIYEKDKYNPAHKTISRGYFLHFATQDMNGIRFWAQTRPKIHYLFRKRRLYNRKKAMFLRYVQRFPARYPSIRNTNGIMVLNSEELATIFHFPMSSSQLPPNIPRIAAKKGGPPPAIPIE